LGAGALAGSSLALEPAFTAQNLGFNSSFANSIDAVSDRDYVAEALFICAMIGSHLSRIGEEWTLWASQEFAWAKVTDAYSTGSSIMPQKKNPDMAELARGKSGRLVGNLMSVLTMLKGFAVCIQSGFTGRQRASIRQHRYFVTCPSCSHRDDRNN
jgi:argininosuccinate lyase